MEYLTNNSDLLYDLTLRFIQLFIIYSGFNRKDTKQHESKWERRVWRHFLCITQLTPPESIILQNRTV